MMKYRYVSILFVLLGAAILLGGCNFPASSGEQVTPEVVYTQAAQTIVAQLTELAAPGGLATLETTATTPARATDTLLPTGTATQTATSTLTATPVITQTITPTASAADPRAGLGDPDWRDRFNNEANWSPYEDEYVRFEIDDGVLIMQVKTSESRDSWMLTWPDPQDYYLEAIAQTDNCGGMDRYGVIFRTDSDQGYLYGFTCSGEYSLRKWDGEQFTALVDWTYSPHILAGEGQVNRMGLRVEDSLFTLYANDYVLDQVADEAYDEGGFGLFVGSRDGELFTVSVDEIAYWELP